MEHYLCTFFVILLVQVCFAPPVTQNKESGNDVQPDSNVAGLEDYMEYHRYLKEVVDALESDPEFRQKLEKADEEEIRSGKIADELQFVSHHVRTRLDEIKRVELQRLKELTEKKRQLEQEYNLLDDDPTHHHLDQNNAHTFEIEDLKKLIAKTTNDLAEADKKRREDFKRYEMEKEFIKQDTLNHTNGAKRDELEKQFKEREEKHKKHEKLHEPGHKAQLEEVWEEQDQMQQDFDPKTFFMLHDIDGNGLWDQEEVKALFIKELDKMYQQGAAEDDMRERIEEMERMRESVFREMDFNRDGFIDYREFLQQTNTNDFKQDNGWQALDEQTKPYTDEELNEYIVKNHGLGYPGAGLHPQVPPNQQFYPGQVPQMAPQQLDLNTNEVYQHQQVPQQQYNHQGQAYQQHNIPQQNQPNYQQNPQYIQQPQYQQYQQQPNQQQYHQPNSQQFQQQANVDGQQFQQQANAGHQQFQQQPNTANQQQQQQFQQQPNQAQHTGNINQQLPNGPPPSNLNQQPPNVPPPSNLNQQVPKIPSPSNLNAQPPNIPNQRNLGNAQPPHQTNQQNAGHVNNISK